MIGRMMLIGGLLLPALSGMAQVSETFDTDIGGWIVQDVDCYSGYTIQHSSVGLSWWATGGDPGGHVTHHDATTYCSFFAAPAAFLGDKSAYLGGYLDFSLFATESDWQDEDVVVLIGAGLVACHELPEMPPSSWRHYIVPLSATAFTYDDQGGGLLSVSDFEAILADLDNLYLPAEFGAEIEETVGLDSVHLRLPGTPVPDLTVAAVRLHGARPNPFNPSTTVVFDLPWAQPVHLIVHDAAGRHVRTLVDGATGMAGPNTVIWNGLNESGRSVPAGIYFCRLVAGAFSETRRMTLVK